MTILGVIGVVFVVMGLIFEIDPPPLGFERLVFWLFPIAGVAILVTVGRYLLQRQKFGQSVFEQAHLGGVIGVGLAGLIRIPKPVAASQFRLRLTCVRVVPDSESTTEHVEWQDETLVQPVPASGSTTVPVAFRVPADVQPSSSNPKGERIEWRLEAFAEVPGVDFESLFEVPVLATGRSAPALVQLLDASARDAPPAEPQSEPGISVRDEPGGLSIDYAAGRLMSFPIGLAAFGFVVALIGIMLKVWQVHPVVAALCLAAVFVFGFSALYIALHSVRVRVDRSQIVIEDRIIIFNRRRVVARGELAAIRPEITLASRMTVYYALRLVRKDGKVVDAGWGIRQRRLADLLIRRIMEKLQLPRDTIS